MVGLLQDTTANDVVICLLSGGGSALLPLPVPGVTLDDLQRLTSDLLRCGATINEINAVRKHLSQVQGGQLARLAAPAPVIALILSDVVGSPLDVIASGPTVPDTSTFADALGVLERYGIIEQTPPAIVAHLRRGLSGDVPETPKPGDPVFEHVQTLVIGDNRIAAQAAVQQAAELGLHTLLLSTYVEGEAREVAKVLAGLGKEIARYGQPLPRPACLIAGGETTVTIRGQGKGGRNQELALAAAIALDGWDDVLLLTVATDGGDGPTDAAGAFADGTTVARARVQGLNPAAYLANNDAYNFFQALGDLLITGPTRTNVNDLTLIFVF
jgi:hydroxypyruvate reductase